MQASFKAKLLPLVPTVKMFGFFLKCEIYAPSDRRFADQLVFWSVFFFS